MAAIIVIGRYSNSSSTSTAACLMDATDSTATPCSNRVDEWLYEAMTSLDDVMQYVPPNTRNWEKAPRVIKPHVPTIATQIAPVRQNAPRPWTGRNYRKRLKF